MVKSTPLKNDGVCQLGLLFHSRHMQESKIHVPVTTNQVYFWQASTCGEYWNLLDVYFQPMALWLYAMEYIGILCQVL